MKPIIRTTIAAAALAFAGGAQAAGPATANLTVEATVVDLCSVNDATLSFGTVNPTTGTVLLPATALVNVTCSLGTIFAVGLGDGLNASSGQRRMKHDSSADYLDYNLFRELLMTSRFGDTDSSDRSSGLGLGLLPTIITVYGAVASGQAAPAGNYSDTVQIVVHY